VTAATRHPADGAAGTDPFTVLVVCTGNVNRSALAAVLLETWSSWYLPSSTTGTVRVTSAGLRAPVGSRMGSRARLIAAALGADGTAHRAAQISEDVVRSADLVLVSSARQRESVLGLVPGALHSTFTIREAGRIAAALPEMPTPSTTGEMRERVSMLAQNRVVDAADDGLDDIVDPQGKDDDAYRLMARQEVPPLASIAVLLFGMPAAEVTAYGEAVEAAVFGLEDEVPPSDDAERPRGRRRA
jgi:protein-tyrosine phosphatase